jgi:hypothetical protein
MRFVGILGGLAGPRRSSTCFSLTDPSRSGSGAVSAENELYIGPGSGAVSAENELYIGPINL